MKNKLTVIGIILTTLILASIAIFTALRLYQTRDVAVAPNVPESKPAAQSAPTQAPTTCSLSFTITTATSTATATATSTATATATSTSTATATATSTATATATATAAAVPQCNNACTSNSNCPDGLMCYIASGQTAGNCRNTQCLSETDCLCNIATNTPTTQPTVYEVGTSWPTLLGATFGIIILIGSLLLAL